MKKHLVLILIALLTQTAYSQVEIKDESEYEYGKGYNKNLVVTFCSGSIERSGDTLMFYTTDKMIYKEPYQLCNKVEFKDLEPGKYYLRCGTLYDSLMIPYTEAILIKKED